MNISCNTAEDLFMLYRDRMVSPETRRQVEEHLHSCEACRRHYAQMTRVMDRLTEAGGEMDDREHSYLQLAAKLRHAKWRKRVLRYTAAAAAVAAGVLITLTVQKRKRNMDRLA